MGLIPWRNKRRAELSHPDGSDLPYVGSLRHHMDRLFSRFFDDPRGAWDTWPASLSGWIPTLDVIDGEKEVTVRVDLPGVDLKDIDVSVSGGMLTIRGEKKSEGHENGPDVYRSERTFGSFRRTLQLPDGVDVEHISAEYANGVLTVRLAKSKAAASKRIAILKK